MQTDLASAEMSAIQRKLHAAFPVTIAPTLKKTFQR